MSTDAERRRFLLGLVAGGIAPPILTGCAARSKQRGGVSSRSRVLDQPHGGAAITTHTEAPPPVPETITQPEPTTPATEPAPFLPSPDLGDDQVLRYVAGIRPYRRGRIRIEAERIGDRLVVHNYGHGGAGVTLSWGSAEEAVELVRLGDFAAPEPVAVLGGGVIGMSTAHVLAERGFSVTLSTKALTPDTTSDLAGAQFAPSLVARGSSAESRAQFDRIVRVSHRRFKSLRAWEWGVSDKPNYQARGGGDGLFDLPEELVPRKELDQLPFATANVRGRVFHTMHIEPPTYLPRLLRAIKSLGVQIEHRAFGGMEQILELPQRVIVNCLGLGAGEVFDDRSLSPMRGQLVHLKPQDLPWLLSHGGGYIFPRRDVVVLGGSVERGRTDPTPVDSTCRAILNRHRRFFA